MPVLRLTPCYKDYLWGGSAFRRMYTRMDAPEPIAAESWEAACHPNGSSRVLGGVYDGMTLDEAAAIHGAGFYGSGVTDGKLPILFKLIDAREKLSVQVHPDDAYAIRDGERGKNEMWIVLKAEPGASLYAGFSAPVTREEFIRHIEAQTLEQILRRLPVKAGDAVMIPAGLVHAIGDGVMIAEVQQNSDATYRVYDWGRVGADGQPRPLHIAKALDVSDLQHRGELAPFTVSEKGGVTEEHWPETPYFCAARLRGNGKQKTTGFHLLFAADGNLTVDGQSYPAGTTLFVTADTDEYTVVSEGYWLRFWGVAPNND